MDLGLAGRVALVCGSTKGLGRAVAKALAHEGARVAINGRHEDSVEQAAQQLSSESAQAVMPFVADVGDPSQAEGLVERVQDRKSTRLNSSHTVISYAVFCLKKKKEKRQIP